MNRRLIIGAVVIIAVGALATWFFMRDEKLAEEKQTMSEQRYMMLSESDAGLTTPLVLPTKIIIQLSQDQYSATTTTISDPDSIMTGQNIESYAGLTLISGVVTKAGSLRVSAPSQVTLEYTFASSSESLRPEVSGSSGSAISN